MIQAAGVSSSSSRLPVVAGAVVFLLVAIIMVGGVAVRSTISTSFQNAENVRSAHALSLEALKLQLDEETGMRGFAATGDRVFLEPYYFATPKLKATFARLNAAVLAVGASEAARPLDDALATNDRWQRTIAGPLINRRFSPTLQRKGKQLVDRFRNDIVSADTVLDVRERAINAAAQSAIGRIVLLSVVAAIIMAGLAVAFFVQQIRTWRRLDEERTRAEAMRGDAAALRASYLAEKRIADTLQDAFAQRPLPSHPALRLSATYVPALEEARVGGDWYDALELPGNRVLFAIGDVTGHGLDAAVGMNRARQALITSALVDSEPAAVLTRVNEDLIRQKASLVTAVMGYADVENCDIAYSVAGHPPPVLMEPGAAPRFLECGALPLGALGEATYQTYRVRTVPGATLILYTDGAVEQTRDVLEGERILLDAVLAAAGEHGSDFAALIHRTIFNGAAAGDDVAILTIGFAERAAEGVHVSAGGLNARVTGKRVGMNEGQSTTTGQQSASERARPSWGSPEKRAS